MTWDAAGMGMRRREHRDALGGILMPVLQAISTSMNEEPVVSLSAVLFICLFCFLK